MPLLPPCLLQRELYLQYLDMLREKDTFFYKPSLADKGKMPTGETEPYGELVVPFQWSYAITRLNAEA